MSRSLKLKNNDYWDSSSIIMDTNTPKPYTLKDFYQSFTIGDFNENDFNAYINLPNGLICVGKRTYILNSPVKVNDYWSQNVIDNPFTFAHTFRYAPAVIAGVCSHIQDNQCYVTRVIRDTTKISQIVISRNNNDAIGDLTISYFAIGI